MVEAGDMQLSASLEDYLEAIFLLIREKSAARAKDIGKRLKVSRSSVTGALHALADRGLINYSPYELISLTEKGAELARQLARKHAVLKDFFERVLGVDSRLADETACGMEHVISEPVLDRFLSFVAFVEQCPRGGSKWIKGFEYFCQSHRITGNCQQCVSLVLDEVKEAEMRNDNAGSASVSLDLLKPKERGSIIAIEGSTEVRRRLLDMGATSGSVVEIERVAPLGDPIDIKIKGYHLSLRKEEAGRVKVRRLEA